MLFSFVIKMKKILLPLIYNHTLILGRMSRAHLRKDFHPFDENDFIIL